MRIMPKVTNNLARRILQRKSDPCASQTPAPSENTWQQVPAKFLTFETLPAYTNMRMMQAAARGLGIGDPFFKMHEGQASVVTRVNGKTCTNFSHYNYLGLSGHKEVNAAAIEAIQRYGTTAGASRLVAGERPVQRELEEALAKVYDAEDALVFVSGHATNVSTISTLFGPKDLVIHDQLAHNSILEGIRLSGATRRSFPHNNASFLDNTLRDLRSRFERVLIVVEGLYSMDGDIPHLPTLIAIKKRHGAFLMVDEAHSLGVLGASGRGIAEHFDANFKDIDIWMGTLTKALGTCGGFIAGSKILVDILKYHAPGFVYSVGISPPLAAAALAALKVMQREPERIMRLRQNSQAFLDYARKLGLNTGLSQGFSIVPIIVGSSKKAVQLSNELYERNINVQPIIYPGVEEQVARLRFFLSCDHQDEDLKKTCQTLKGLI